MFLFHRCNIVFLLSVRISTFHSSFLMLFVVYLILQIPFLYWFWSLPFISCLVTVGYPFMFGGTKKHIGSGLSVYWLHCRVTAGARSFVGGCFVPGVLHSGKGLAQGKGISLVQNTDLHLIPLFLVQHLSPVPNVPEHRSFLS